MTAAATGVIAGFTEKILTLPGWLVLSLVFLFPALEASAFVGFVFPGEIAVILGGVAASRGTVSLWAVIVAAVSGAIIGDSVGYFIGRRWGDRVLFSTIGRLPLVRRELDKHLDSARAYVRRRRGSAVFFGRFTTALRVLVPGLAGLSNVEYPAFLAYNVAGGATWGTAFAVLGYLAGARGPIESSLRRAMIYGSVVASFCCEGFGLNRTTRVTRKHIEQRARHLEKLARF